MDLGKYADAAQYNLYLCPQVMNAAGVVLLAWCCWCGAAVLVASYASSSLCVCVRVCGGALRLPFVCVCVYVCMCGCLSNNCRIANRHKFKPTIVCRR
jgi:hypothetical protein